MTVQRKSTHRTRRTPGSPARSEPAELRSTYEVQITGALPPLLLTGLDDVVVTTISCETILHRLAPDQDALGDFLNRLHDLGLTIFELHRLPDPLPSLGSP